MATFPTSTTDQLLTQLRLTVVRGALAATSDQQREGIGVKVDGTVEEYVASVLALHGPGGPLHVKADLDPEAPIYSDTKVRAWRTSWDFVHETIGETPFAFEDAERVLNEELLNIGDRYAQEWTDQGSPLGNPGQGRSGKIAEQCFEAVRLQTFEDGGPLDARAREALAGLYREELGDQGFISITKACQFLLIASQNYALAGLGEDAERATAKYVAMRDIALGLGEGKGI